MYVVQQSYSRLNNVWTNNTLPEYKERGAELVARGEHIDKFSGARVRWIEVAPVANPLAKFAYGI